MNKRKYLSILTALLVAVGLGACSSDSTTSAASPDADQGIITFTLGGSAKTRAVSLEGEDYEKNIKNVNVVAYKNGKLTANLTDETDGGVTESSGTYKANVGASGVMEVYFIVNAGTGLKTKIAALAAESAPSALEALIVADQLPGEYQATSSEGFFPMVGKKSVTVKAKDNPANGTSIGDVTVARLAARIDIGNMPAGFTLKKAQLKNYYNTSVLVRADGDTDMTKEGLTKTNGTEVDMTVTDNLTGHLYVFEDVAAAPSLEVVLTGEIGGVTVTPTVKFATPAEGTAVPVKRNTVYTVNLNGAAAGGDPAQLSATIVVNDWDTGAALAATDVLVTPSTAVVPTTVNIASGTGYTVEAETDAQYQSDPWINSVATIAGGAAATITVTVENAANNAAKLVCTSPVSGEGIQITEGTATTANGITTQTFTVAISANAAGAIFTVEAQNTLNNSMTKKFRIVQNP